MNEARLITIPFSHYCEKARWALDATGALYREEPHAPVLHRRATGRAGGRTVPVLVHEGRAWRDSTEIAHYADTLATPEHRLIPDGEEGARVLALEDELDETLGIDARLLVYWCLLKDADLARVFAGRMLGVRGSLVQAVVGRLFRRLIFRKYAVNAGTAQRAEARVRETFAHIGESLVAQPYLVGQRFTLADLTFAALASPLLGPPEHPVIGRTGAGAPSALAALRAELASTRAGEHALRVYRDHRGRKGRATGGWAPHRNLQDP